MDSIVDRLRFHFGFPIVGYCEICMYLPEEIQCQHDLKRSRPQHVEEGGEVHEPLSVHRHEIHYFSHCRRTLGSVSYRQSLKNKRWGGETTVYNPIINPIHVNLLSSLLENNDVTIQRIPSCRWLLWERCGHSCQWRNSTESGGAGWEFAVRLWRTWGRPACNPTNQEHLSVLWTRSTS